MSLKSLSKELLDAVYGGDLERNKLLTLARGIYAHANGNAVLGAGTTETPLNSAFASKEDYDRWTGKLDPIELHGHQLSQRFAAHAVKITPAMARQIAGCRYTPDGRVAFWP